MAADTGEAKTDGDAEAGFANMLAGLQEILASQRRIEQELKKLSRTRSEAAPVEPATTAREVRTPRSFVEPLPQNPRVRMSQGASEERATSSREASAVHERKSDTSKSSGIRAETDEGYVENQASGRYVENEASGRYVENQSKPSFRASSRKNLRRATHAIRKTATIGDLLKHGIKGKEDKTLAARIAGSDWFDAIMIAIICVNVVILAVETEYRGLVFESGLASARLETCHQHTMSAMSIGGEGPRYHPEWSGADQAFDAIEWFFGVIFWVEFAIRVMGMRCKLITRPSAWIDAVVVVSWTLDKAGSFLPLNPQIIRLARLARLMRVMKLLRVVPFFDFLQVFNAAIVSSMMSLMWSTFVLTLVLTFCALVIGDILFEYYFKHFRNASTLDIDTWNMYLCFGTFTRCLFSMYELALANWPPVARLLTEEVSQWFMLVTVGHKLIIGFAMVGVINAIFMQGTFECVNLDDSIMVRQKARIGAIHKKKIQRLFHLVKDADDESGTVSMSEFMAILANKEVATWWSSMGFDKGDVEITFRMFAGEDGRITETGLIEGVEHLKRPARSIDILSIMTKGAYRETALNFSAAATQSFSLGAMPMGSSPSGRACEFDPTLSGTFGYARSHRNSAPSMLDTVPEVGLAGSAVVADAGEHFKENSTDRIQLPAADLKVTSSSSQNQAPDEQNESTMVAETTYVDSAEDQFDQDDALCFLRKATESYVDGGITAASSAVV